VFYPVIIVEREDGLLETIYIRNASNTGKRCLIERFTALSLLENKEAKEDDPMQIIGFDAFGLSVLKVNIKS